jgi:hypothetical protein
MMDVPPLTAAERQALAFQAILRVYMTAPDHRVDVDVMEAVETQKKALADLNLESMILR